MTHAFRTRPFRARPFRATAAFALVALLGLAALGSALAAPKLRPVAERADMIVVEKAARKLLLMRDGKVIAEYAVALGRNPVGDKEQQGDRRTPEGRYRIDYKNAGSAYHLSLHITYPDRKDRQEARARGVSPGGDIMIHGLPNGLGFIGLMHRAIDWTDGCIAVTDDEIEDIWSRVPVGTPIEIKE